MPHIADFACGDRQHDGNCAPQVDHRMGFDTRFCGSKVGPGKQFQTQVDGGGVHGIERLLETQANVMVLVQIQRDFDQALPQCFEQMRITPLIGIGQRGVRYTLTQAAVVELGALRVQAHDQITQALSAGELRVGHADEVAPCGEVPCPAVGHVLVNEVFKVAKRYDGQQLCKYRATCVHNVNLKK